MALRVVRALFGLVLLLIGLPLLLAGGGLWLMAQHRDDGAYRAPLADIATDGHAIAVSDLDSLLRTDAPFVRASQTTLRVTAHTDTGPAFIGLAPAGRLADYLAGVPHAEVDQVRLARGPLPVSVVPVQGTAPPDGAPGEQRFWLAASSTGSLEWTPSEFRGEPVSLVIMRPEGVAPLRTTVVADLRPQWLTSATFGALVLGTVLALVGIAALVWTPRSRSRSREIVYVVPPAQVPEVAAHLGMPAPPGSAEPGRALGRVEPDPTPGEVEGGRTLDGLEPDRPIGPAEEDSPEWSPPEADWPEWSPPEAEVVSDSAATPDLDPLTDLDDLPPAPEADLDGANSVGTDLEAGPDGAELDGVDLEAGPDGGEPDEAALEVLDGAEPDGADLEAAEPGTAEPESEEAAEPETDPEIVDLGEVQVGSAGVGSDRAAPRVVAPRLATASLPPPWPPPAQPWVTAEPAPVPVPELQEAGQS